MKDITLFYICYDVTCLFYIMSLDWFLEKNSNLENTAMDSRSDIKFEIQ